MKNMCENTYYSHSQRSTHILLLRDLQPHINWVWSVLTASLSLMPLPWRCEVHVPSPWMWASFGTAVTNRKWLKWSV